MAPGAVEGEQRGQVERLIQEEGAILLGVQAIDDFHVGEREAEVFTRPAECSSPAGVQLQKKVLAEVFSSRKGDQVEQPVDTMAAALKIEQKQDTADRLFRRRGRHVLALLERSTRR
ncbi:hypothetical protein P4123_30520 [Pseudomonas aeruginosa]|nr:hypothetical protein [Pseudomonas aeruginosa]